MKDTQKTMSDMTAMMTAMNERMIDIAEHMARKD